MHVARCFKSCHQSRCATQIGLAVHVCVYPTYGIIIQLRSGVNQVADKACEPAG